MKSVAVISTLVR